MRCACCLEGSRQACRCCDIGSSRGLITKVAQFKLVFPQPPSAAIMVQNDAHAVKTSVAQAYRSICAVTAAEGATPSDAGPSSSSSSGAGAKVFLWQQRRPVDRLWVQVLPHVAHATPATQVQQHDMLSCHAMACGRALCAPTTQNVAHSYWQTTHRALRHLLQLQRMAVSWTCSPRP